MTRLAAVVITVTTLVSFGACSDDTGGDIDAAPDAIDAAIDVPDGPCGADYQMTGEYIDWESTQANFAGVPATWTLTTPPGTSATGAPNGRVLICLPRSTVTLSVTLTGSPGPYIAARFVADPAVLAVPGGIFSARGLKMANANTSYNAIMGGMTFDTAAGHVLVHKRGTPTALTLTGATSYVSDGDNDITWTAGNTGTFTLFPNVPVGVTGMGTLGGTFTGPTSIPIVANTLTIVPIS